MMASHGGDASGASPVGSAGPDATARPPLRILIHDFCGHPFTLQLAVRMAADGHEVHYAYFAGDPGPKGDFAQAAAQPRSPRLHGLTIADEYRKDAFVKRRRDDLSYARKLSHLVRQLQPDVLLSGNCPTEVQDQVVRACKATNSAFVYWMQDFYSIAATKLLGKKLGFIGRAIGGYWRHLDRKHLRAADRIVLITEDFRPLTAEWAGRSDNIDVVENWGALAEIPQRPRDNDWSSRHMKPGAGVRFLYSGTLGLKHNPELLAALARMLGDRGTVTVTSQGMSVPYLQQRREELGLDNLHLLPLQPFADVPDMLGAADVLVAVIEPDAGTFSVPSKVLSYLCAGRPILLAAPADNLASKIVNKTGAGLTVPPEDEASFLAAAARLLDEANRAGMGDRGRAYAEANFEIGAVARRFEGIFRQAIADKTGK